MLIVAKLFLYGLLMFYSLRLVYFKRAKAIFYFPVILIFLEIFFTYFKHLGNFDWLHGFNLLFLLLIISPLLRYKNIYLWSPLIILFILYISLRITYSEDPVSLFTRVTNFSLLLLLIPCAYYSTTHISDIKTLNKSAYNLLVVYSVSTILFSFLEIGENMYSTGIIYGLAHDQINAVGVCIGMFPVISLTNRRLGYKNFVFILALALLALTLRRTPMLIIISSILFYILLNSSITNKIKIVVGGISLLVFLVYIMDIVGVEIRFFAIDKYKPELTVEEKIEEEGRYKDMVDILDYLNEKKIKLMGTGYLFDTRGRYGLAAHLDNRPIHNNYAELLHGAGFLGLILFLGIFINILIKVETMRIYKRTGNHSIIKAAIYFLLLTSVIISISGGVRTVGASILYIYLGTLLRFYRNISSEHFYRTM